MYTAFVRDTYSSSCLLMLFKKIGCPRFTETHCIHRSTRTRGLWAHRRHGASDDLENSKLRRCISICLAPYEPGPLGFGHERVKDKSGRVTTDLRTTSPRGRSVKAFERVVVGRVESPGRVSFQITHPLPCHSWPSSW